MPICPICGEDVAEGAGFCPSCKSYLGWSQEGGDEDDSTELIIRRPDEEVGPRQPAVTLRATPSVVELRRGDAAQITVQVNNHTSSDEIYQLGLRHEVPLSATVEPSDSIPVGGGEQAEVVLTVELPTHVEFEGSTMMSVRVNSTKNPENAAAQFIEIRPDLSPAAYWSVASPRQSGLRSSSFRATLHNEGRAPIAVAPMVATASQDLETSLDPDHLEVPGGETAPLTVGVTAKRLNWSGGEQHQMTVTGGEGVVGNRLDLVFSQLSTWWLAGPLAAIALALIVVLAGALGTGSGSEDTLAQGDTTTTQPATTTSSTTQPATTTTAAPATTVPDVDLGITGYEIVIPGCTDQYITVLYSAIDPDRYQADVAENLANYPGSEYLRTDHSCQSLRQELDGNPIYAVFYGPFDAPEEACAALADEQSYVRLLSETVPSEEASFSCE